MPARPRRLVLPATVAAFILAACAGGDSHSAPTEPTGSTTATVPPPTTGGTTQTPPPAPTPSPAPAPTNSNAGLVTGTVVDAAGRPIYDATVSAENTLLSGSWVQGGTDAQGRYKLDVNALPATWHARAFFFHEYNGHLYQFDLHPDNDAVFAGSDGAVRNFDWRLTGERPNSGGLQFYGNRVNVYPDFYHMPDGVLTKDVELTFVPVGPLVDGSAGKPLTLRAANGGPTIEDVPLGTYTITARIAQVGQAPRPLQVRLSQGTADFADQATGVWPQEKYLNIIGSLDLEVRDPASGVYPAGLRAGRTAAVHR